MAHCAVSTLILCFSFGFVKDLPTEDRIKGKAGFTVLSEQLNQSLATEACRQLGMWWDLPDGLTRQEQLHVFLEENNIQAMWLTWKRRVSKLWKWVDKTAYGGSMPNYPNVNCAVLTAQKSALDAVQCVTTSNDIGFICQMPAWRSCPLTHLLHSCFSINSTVFYFGCSAKSFYEARSHCLDNQADLAVIKDSSQNQQIIGKAREKGISVCYWFYVGLNREEWQMIKPNGTTHTLQDVSHWKRGEPSSGNCSLIERTRRGNGWLAAECNKVKQVVCQNYLHDESLKISSLPTSQPISSITTQGAPGNVQRNIQSTGDATSTKTIVAIVVSGVMVSAVIVVVAFATRYRCGEGPNTRTETHRPIDEESLPLKDQNNTLDQSLLGFVKKYKTTVLVISTYSDPEQNTEGVPITCISQKGEILSWERYESSKMVGHVILAAKMIIPDNNNQLGILVIPDDKVNLKDLECIVNTFVEEKTFPSVILLPGAKMEANVQTLATLVKLKNSCVCLTAAKYENNIIPATDVVSVGDIHHWNETIKSGCLDFIRGSESDSGTTGTLTISSIEEAAANIAGIFAGLHNRLVKDSCEKYNQVEKKTSFMRRLMYLSMSKEGSSCDIERPGLLSVTQETIGHFKGCDLWSLVSENDNIWDFQSTRSPSRSNFELPTKKLLKELFKTPSQTPIRVKVLRRKLAQDKKDEVTDFKKVLTEVLNSDNVTESIDFSSTDTYGSFTEFKKEILDCKKEIEKLCPTKPLPDIVVIAAINLITDGSVNSEELNKAMRQLRDKCVVITNLRGMEGKRPPLAYPADSVIAVKMGREDLKDLCGSTVDFAILNDTERSSMWAALITAMYAGAVLHHAKQHNLDEDIYTKLHQTHVMRSVLRHMSSHPEDHYIQEGYGALSPHLWQEPERLTNIIKKYTGINAPMNLWLGKDLESCEKTGEM